MNRVKDLLRSKAINNGYEITSDAFATHMDTEDPLKSFRDEFEYPLNKYLDDVDLSLVNGEEQCVYLCGNSLGLLPKKSRLYVNNEMDKWARIGVHGHFQGDLPWAHCDNVIRKDMANIVGAKPGEVAVMNALTVNQNLLLISFYRPTSTRFKILMEDESFPSDHYSVESHVRLHGYDPAECVIKIKPREGYETLNMDDIVSTIEEEGDSIALIMLPGIHYYTGQFLDIPRITIAGHKKGCYVGFDCAHSVGNAIHKLHDWNVDFACWCSYKYLNSGAGGIGGMFIHENHKFNNFPKLHGWWSNEDETRFLMKNDYKPAPSPDCYRISNPSMFLTASLKGALEVHNEATMEKLREKSELLTMYLETLILHYYPKHENSCANGRPFVEIITPLDPEQRGCQLSIRFSSPITAIFQELQKRGIVCDKREPGVLRIAPAPIYNSFTDVFKFIKYLNESIASINKS